MKLEQERELLTEYGRRMSRAGLSVGTSGNLSIYVPEEGLMAITPSGLDYEATTPAGGRCTQSSTSATQPPGRWSTPIPCTAPRWPAWESL